MRNTRNVQMDMMLQLYEKLSLHVNRGFHEQLLHDG